MQTISSTALDLLEYFTLNVILMDILPHSKHQQRKTEVILQPEDTEVYEHFEKAWLGIGTPTP